MTQPLLNQRKFAPLVGVLLQCLNEEQNLLPGAFASGFIRREGEGLYLYTCWHVVSGFDPSDVKVGLTLPTRRYLKVALQSADLRQEGVEVIGGLQTVIVPLYDTSTQPPRPRWFQDNRHIPHPDLNAIGIYVPFWHDVVKLELPPDLQVSKLQVINEAQIFQSLVGPGDKCLVVGYPYGFSAFGPEQPTPVALTRFVASDRIAGRRQQLLLESIGAPGMSGGPVFIERGEDLFLLGLYTGSIYPDYAQNANEKVTALGTVADLSLVFKGYLPMVATPSEAHIPGGS